MNYIFSAEPKKRNVRIEKSEISRLRNLYTSYSDNNRSAEERAELWEMNDYDIGIKDTLDYLMCIPAFRVIDELDKLFLRRVAV